MKAKTLFYCTECGNEFPKWMGKCSACGAWNTVVEQPTESRVVRQKKGAAQRQNPAAGGGAERRPRRLEEIHGSKEIRFSTGLGELDRVLGGGAVRGSLVLVGGEPGIGKSTLLLQICRSLAQEGTVLYVSGEESEQQLKLRAQRLHLESDSVYCYGENHLENICQAAEELSPGTMIVDSIQTIYHGDLTASPGSVSQVKECTMTLMQLAKQQNMTVFIIGHVTKEGALAGPKVLEHMVDCVLSFEGERHTAYRILRAVKNRFGATNEIGVFSMEEEGLTEVPNPSELLLSGRMAHAAGSCVTCTMEGGRPVLAEIQGLLANSAYGTPRRNSNGFDYNRAMLLLAVLEKRGGLPLGGCDAYLNVVGGLSLNEPASDLAAVLALASSFRDKPLPDTLVAVGEVGLTGEIRGVNLLSQRLGEIRRLGFTQCLLPKVQTGKKAAPVAPEGLQLIPVANLREALAVLL